MPDDVFRIVITVAVALASLAFLVQAGVVIALYRATRKTQEEVLPLVGRVRLVIDRIGPLLDRVQPFIEKAGPVVDQLGPAVERIGPLLDKAGALASAAHEIVVENGTRIAEISTEVAAIAKVGRQQVERIGGLVADASDRARHRLDQIDDSLERTVGQIGQVGDSMKHAAMRPAREVNGLAAGVSAVISTLVRGRKSPVDAATQDEEMFI